MEKNIKIIDGNEAAAYIGYRVTEVNVIYPITPSSAMGEFADQWSGEKIKNIWQTVPQVIEMQSEGGAAGALHGALQTGALATTYTASQGLLLMLPNMYKIAGELTSAVIHVSSRSLAAQALSIFGDHSDVMAVRDTGFALLASGSVQEAHDLALIAHAATLAARVPFLHFFEGFRVSHEVNKITGISDENIRAMIDEEFVLAHRQRALTPEHPVLRGTAQNPDVYFQGRETVNSYYLKIPAIVSNYMDRFATLTGRKYSLMNYYGAPDAQYVIVIMGSGAKAVMQTVKKLNDAGEKVGVIQVYLYRPFATEHFLKILPSSVRVIAVLDRTKEPGSLGEPLYQDVLTALVETNRVGDLHLEHGLPQVVGGRYGLSSKEFTPAMAKGIYDALKQKLPKNRFTIGIKDDVTDSSISYDSNYIIEKAGLKSAIFYGLGSDGTVGANKNTIKIIGHETDLYTQGYFVYDSKKSGSKTVSHLRFSSEPIDEPYLVAQADFIGCHQFEFVSSPTLLDNAKIGATFLLNTTVGSEEIWHHLPQTLIEKIYTKKIKFYIVDAYKVALATSMGARINTIMQTCFFAISNILPRDTAIAKIKEAITKTYHRKGEDVVKQNFAAVDQTLANLIAIELPSTLPQGGDLALNAFKMSDKAPEFVQKVTAAIIAERGDELPVSALPADGTYPTGTTKWEKRNVSLEASEWHADLCVQCGQCSMICPHSVLRAKHFSTNALTNAPPCFISSKCRVKELAEEQFRIQVYLEDCTGCGLCHEVCPVVSKTDPALKAITLSAKAARLADEKRNIDFFETLPYAVRSAGATVSVRDVQYLQPYFEFSGACAGCGETPYLKLLTQLFGERMLVANATGCSSIYGGNLPTTPWTCDAAGHGPAWSNSLFEDNAEFGYGFRLAVDKQQELAVELLREFSSTLGDQLINEILSGINEQDAKSLELQRQRVGDLKNKLVPIAKTNIRAAHLGTLAEYFIKRSIWIVGGDGWAYDIGYGGLDHVLASDRKVNVLVLDTEVYSNTGGQASKSTPRAATAKFAATGKGCARKDLGMIAMSYGNIYVAQIALGANPTQSVQALLEAENYAGPSLVIAYSHCIAHGYNLRQGVKQQKLAVASGFWPLYRYHPDRVKQGLNPLQLDSKEPTIDIKEYAYNEPRFKRLVTDHPERAAELIKQLQEDIRARWQSLVQRK